MARNFASDTDSVYKIDADHWTVPSGPITIGMFCKFTTYKMAQFFQLNKWGVAVALAMHSMDYGSGDQRMAITVGYSTTPKIIVSNYGSFTADNTWHLWVCATDGSPTHTNWRFYKGDVGGSMADILTASGGEHAGQNGTGTVITGGTRAIIGNDWNNTSGVRCAIGECFAVTGQMTVADMDRLLDGDWDAITDTGSLFFWAPLDGSDVEEYVAPLTLDVAGTTSVADPRLGGFGEPPTEPYPIAVRGIRTSTGTGDATVTVLNPDSIAVGNVLLARVSVDNSGSSGAAPGLAVTDSANNTWTVHGPANRDPGTSSSGITAYLCRCTVVNPYDPSDTIVFNYTTGTPRSSIVVEEWANLNEDDLVEVAATTNSNGSTSVATTTISPTAIGQLVYAMAAVEGFASDFGTQDTDTTDGSWVELTKDEANTATASTSTAVYGGYKIVTGTSAQVWNNTLGTSRDWAAIAIVFNQSPSVAITGTPTAIAVAAGSGVITATTAITGTSASITVAAGTGIITGPVARPRYVHIVPQYAVHRSTFV